MIKPPKDAVKCVKEKTSIVFGNCLRKVYNGHIIDKTYKIIINAQYWNFLGQNLGKSSVHEIKTNKTENKQILLKTIGGTQLHEEHKALIIYLI